MSHFKSGFGAFAITAGLAIFASAANAFPMQLATGVPLSPGERCAVQFFEQDGSGPLLAKVPARFQGRYTLRVYRPSPTGELLIDTGGPISPTAGREHVLARAQLSYHDFVSRDGLLVAPPLSRPEYRAGAVRAELNVYNARGRLVCQDTEVAQYPFARWNDSAALVVSAPVTPAPYYQNREARASAEAARQAEAAAQARALEQQYGIRYRSPTANQQSRWGRPNRH